MGQNPDAGDRLRLGHIDRADPGVRDRGAHERGVQRAGERDVVDVLPLTGEEPGVLTAAHALADHPRIAFITQAMNTPCNSSRAHSAGAPPGICG